MTQCRLWLWGAVGPAESHVPKHLDGGDGDQGEGVRLCEGQDHCVEVSASRPIQKRRLSALKCHEVKLNMKFTVRILHGLLQVLAEFLRERTADKDVLPVSRSPLQKSKT